MSVMSYSTSPIFTHCRSNVFATCDGSIFSFVVLCSFFSFVSSSSPPALSKEADLGMLSADLGESRPPFASTPPRFVSAFRIVVVALVLLDARCVRLVLAPSIVSSLPMLSIYSDWNFYYWTKKNDPPPKRRSVSFPQKIDTKKHRETNACRNDFDGMPPAIQVVERRPNNNTSGFENDREKKIAF